MQPLYEQLEKLDELSFCEELRLCSAIRWAATNRFSELNNFERFLAQTLIDANNEILIQILHDIKTNAKLYFFDLALKKITRGKKS